MTARSPKSWLRSFRYGVSPQPAQAPENSKSGGSSWASLTWVVFTGVAIDVGQVEEEPPVLRLLLPSLGHRHHVDGLVPDLALALGGAHLDAERAAGAVFGRDLERVARVGELAPAGRRRLERRRAHRRRARARTPWRGSPHADRRARTCRTGCRGPRPTPESRRRCRASPTGSFRSDSVPSTGNALTGSWSPSPAIMRAVTSLDEFRRLRRHRRPACPSCWTRDRGPAPRADARGWHPPRPSSSARPPAPRFPYVFSMACLMAAMASSRGSTPLMAKKHVCITVLMRPPMPASRATRSPSTTKNRRCLAMIVAWTARGSWSQTSRGRTGC